MKKFTIIILALFLSTIALGQTKPPGKSSGIVIDFDSDSIAFVAAKKPDYLKWFCYSFSRQRTWVY